MLKKGRVWIKWAASLMGAGLFCSIAVYFIYPDVSELKKQNPKLTSFMQYRMDEWQDKGKKINIRKQWVSLKRVSPCVIKAIIIAEDDKFWFHEGFDFEAIQKAIEKDLKKKKLKAGGSTISQQLAKNLYLTPSKNPIRKIKEAILTWRLENNLSKRRIIELYINVAEWGEGIFGIEAAAQHYFGKSSAALSAYEAARLASVLPNPRRYNAAGDSRYVEKRADLIYRIMVKRGIVIPIYEELMSQPDDMTLEEAEKLEQQIESGASSEQPNPEPETETPPASADSHPTEEPAPLIPEIPGVTVPAVP
ncbi:MAG: monofunctional biosynthetic peptidoglycan transglycosylase [Syntrophaceae bacterium]|nr:monofunctional biosynthetic peptidoglycan transglycosylase [Syntrophaceae bacterium]